jgi:hypothetical protein
MQTKNHNEKIGRKLLIAILEMGGSATIEQLWPLANVDEHRFTHALSCLRYENWAEDHGDIWRLTDGGREYAEWCKRFPQRYRRLQTDMPTVKAVAPIVNLKVS